MKRLWRFLLTGDWHLHHWETMDAISFENELGINNTAIRCRCTICGEWKCFKV